MSNGSSFEIIQQLRAIEQRSRPIATDLPTGVDDQDYLEGLLFTLVDRRMMVALSDVKEILNFPPAVTPVPGTKEWILGISNVRGNLLPLVDLQVFLGGRAIPHGRRNRVLVINHHDTQVGLSIGEVYGVRQFTEERRVEIPDIKGPVTKYLTGAFQLDDKTLPVFSMALLSESAGFQVAAA